MGSLLGCPRPKEQQPYHSMNRVQPSRCLHEEFVGIGPHSSEQGIGVRDDLGCSGITEKQQHMGHSSHSPRFSAAGALKSEARGIENDLT